MRQEYKLILNTVIKERTERKVNEIESILNEELDWCLIMGQLANHRLASYFYFGLTYMQRKRMPKEMRRLMGFLVEAQEQESISKYKEFSKISLAFEKNNVKYSALKGLLFCADFYELAERRSNDMDIMILEKDIEKVDEILRGFGYIQSLRPNGKLVEATRKEKMLQRLKYHDLIPYMKEDETGFFELDINFRFDDKDNDIDEEIFGYGTVTYNNHGVSVCGLPFNTHLMFLCIHFYREATNTLWTSTKRDILLYKVIDIINCIITHYEELNVDEWCQMVQYYNISHKCYYAFNVISQIYTNDKVNRIKNVLEPVDSSFLNEIYVDGENRYIHRQIDYVDTVFDWTM